MSKEKDKLNRMLEEKKITESDYKLLTTAIDKKLIFSRIEESLLINPFRKIAGIKALVIGFTIMISMCILGVFANIYYEGIFGCLLAINIKSHLQPGFYLLFYQSAVNWIVLAMLYITCAVIFRQKRIRFIDFFGTVGLSRYPYLVLVSYFAILKIIHPSLFDIHPAGGYVLRLTILGTVSSFVWTVCYAWQMLTYFFALKEASGLNGRPLWLSYIISMLLGNFISSTLTMIFLYNTYNIKLW